MVGFFALFEAGVEFRPGGHAVIDLVYVGFASRKVVFPDHLRVADDRLRASNIRLAEEPGEDILKGKIEVAEFTDMPDMGQVSCFGSHKANRCDRRICVNDIDFPFAYPTAN